MIQGRRVVWIALERQTDPAHRFHVIAALMKNDADQMQAVKVVRANRKNLAIDGFCLGQPPHLMQLEAFVE